jgi:small subunit ribosomal protein S21
VPWLDKVGQREGQQPGLALRRKKGGRYVTEVIVGDNENFESALKRFTKKVQQDGILAEARRREHFEKPSVRRKKKEAARRRKAAAAARRG